METFDTPSLLVLARQRRADEIAAQELAAQQRREAEYAQRQYGLLLFCNQFDLDGPHESFETIHGVTLPYLPLGPLAIVGTADHAVTVYFRCKECGAIAYKPNSNLQSTLGACHAESGKLVFGEHEVLRVLGDLDARAAQIGPLCPAHQPESEG